MDTQAAQHRQQIEQTRTAMTAKLDLLKQHVSRKVAATVEQTVIAPVRGFLWTAAKGTTLLQQYPWLIIAGGVLFGYQMSGANTRRIRPVQSLPQRAIGAPPNCAASGGARHASGLRLTAAAVHTSSGPAGAGGTHGGDPARVTPVRLEARGLRREGTGAPGHARNPGG
jgi:hypothetical protein